MYSFPVFSLFFWKKKKKTNKASVLRMLHEYLDEQVFMKCISIYLRNHAYGNATTNDLWCALDTARVEEIDSSSSSSANSVTSEVTVSELMSEWILQSGFPVVSVSCPEHGMLEIQQQKFSAVNGKKSEKKPAEEEEEKEEEEENLLWSIPLNLTGLGGHYHRRHLFQTKWECLIVPVDMLREVDNEGGGQAPLPQWWLLNSGRVGFFRVNYS